MKACSAVRERGGLGLRERLVQPYMYCERNLGKFQALASQADTYYSFGHQTSSNCWQKLEVTAPSHAPDVSDRPKPLHSALRSLAGFIMETLYKVRHNIHLDDVVDAIFLRWMHWKTRSAYEGNTVAVFWKYCIYRWCSSTAASNRLWEIHKDLGRRRLCSGRAGGAVKRADGHVCFP